MHDNKKRNQSWKPKKRQILALHVRQHAAIAPKVSNATLRQTLQATGAPQTEQHKCNAHAQLFCHTSQARSKHTTVQTSRQTSNQKTGRRPSLFLFLINLKKNTEKHHPGGKTAKKTQTPAQTTTTKKQPPGGALCSSFLFFLLFSLLNLNKTSAAAAFCSLFLLLTKSQQKLQKQTNRAEKILQKTKPAGKTITNTQTGRNPLDPGFSSLFLSVFRR